jgi:hypothetical protein
VQHQAVRVTSITQGWTTPGGVGLHRLFQRDKVAPFLYPLPLLFAATLPGGAGIPPPPRSLTATPPPSLSLTGTPPSLSIPPPLLTNLVGQAHSPLVHPLPFPSAAAPSLPPPLHLVG